LTFYLSNWIIDRSIFKKTIKNFVASTKIYRQTSIYISFFFFFETKFNNLTKKRSFLNSKLFVSRTAIRFQKVDNISILKRNRRSLDFSVSILSIFSILFVQKVFFNFRNNSIFSTTQISTKSVLSKYYTANDSKKRRETSEISTDEQEKNTSIRIKILSTIISIITKNKDLVNNLAMQKLINQTIIRILTNYNT